MNFFPLPFVLRHRICVSMRTTELAMLRITTNDRDAAIDLRLEGKLAGPWVDVMRDCWRRQLVHCGDRTIHVDLRAVSFVDASGKKLLGEMSAQNAKLIAGDCQMKAILAEINRPGEAAS